MTPDDGREVVEIGARALHADRLPEFQWEEADELWQNDQRGHVRAILTALEASGRKIVPVEPTEEMIRASRQALGKHILSLPASERIAAKGYAGGFRVHDESFKARIRYQAMLSASPKATG